MTDKKTLFVKGYFRNKLLRKTITFIMLLLFSFNIFAEVVPDPASIGTRATKTASGVDQLDIATPNKNGTSYNSLKELQVSEQGLILNNNKDIVVNTKTAGYVARNRNLDNSAAANLIITEVTGKNRTNINGTVEVAGKRADLVMANRNGIYVNGGNFLNTDRVTLTTGSLQMKNGDLVGIDVSQGQIGIGGKGLDALGLTELELLGKTIDIAGIIKTSKETRLLVSAGGQTYEYKTKEVKSKGETYEGIAIDGKAVGSMYAGKIDIISNDKGAGVNTKGDLVSVDDIVLTANGDITTAKVDSGKDLKYKTTQKVKMNGKTTVAKKVKIKAKETEINAKVVTGYLEKALGKKSLDIESEKTNITAKIEAQGKIKINSNQIQNSGEIFVTEKVNIAGNKLNNNNGEIRSNQKIEINTKETSNVKGYILSDGLTKEDVKKEENKNTKNTEEVKNKEKGINITGDLDNTEGVIRGREVSLGDLTGNSKGKIDSIGALTFNGKTIVNKGGLISGNIQELNVDRLINDEGKLLSTEKINGTAKEISNKNGEILGVKTVTLVGDKLNNLSGLIKSNGKIALDIKETSNVKGYILSDGLTKEDIKKEENKNQKSVEEDKNKEKGINITGDLDNTEGVIRGREVSLGDLTGNSKGKIDSIGALTFNGKTIVNKGGLISGNIQELNVDRLINDEGKLLSTEKINGTAKEISNKNGEILGVKTVTLVGDKLNNLSGVIRSYGKVKLNEKDVSNVEGYILSDGITKEQAQNWKVEEKAVEESKEDKKDVKEKQEKKEQTTGTLLNIGRLDNTKGIIASLSQTTVNVGKITNNDGKIVSKGAVELTTPNEYEYKGLVEGDYSTTLNAKKIIINNNIDRKNTLSLISKEELTLGQSIRARILSIATQADLRNTKDISATNLLSITAKNIENSGNLYSNGNTYLETKNGDLINKDGGSIKADKQVYIKVENGRVVNGTAKYLDGAYRREDGVLVDNRQTSKEKPSIIAGKTETIIKAKDFINTSLIGKAGQGITYIELTGQGINASIGDNIAKIEGKKVSVEGNKGVANIGAVISGTEITRVTSKNGKVLNESTITTEELTRTVEKKKKFLRKKYTEVYGTIERIRNIGKIEGNGIVYVEGKEIENIVGNIGGAGGTLLKSTEGNIEDKTITLVDNRKDGSWDIVNKTKTVSGVIGNGKDTILDSAKDLILESSDIRAKDNIVLNAKNSLLMLSTVNTEYKFKTETSSKRKWGRKKTTTKTWAEDNIYANPVELTSGGNILINYRGKGKSADNKGVFAQGVNFKTKGGIIAQSDGNIYIQGVKDKLNSTYDSHTTKSFIGIKYKRTSDYISDNREKYKHSQLYGEAGVTLDSQGRLRVEGIDIQTIGPVYLKGVKGVEILSGNEVSSRYEVHTSKNFKIGSDKVLKIEQNKNTKEIDTIKSIGSIINSKGSMVTIEGDKVVSIGSKIGAAGDIKLIGKNGVVIKDGENFAKIREETEKMRAGMFTSLSLKNLSAGIGVEATYNKTNEGKTIVTPEKNTFVTNKNIYITSSEGNVLLQGDFGAKENIGITAEKGKIYIKDSKSEILTDSKSVNARVALTLGTSLSGLKDTLKSSFNVVKNSKELLKMPKIAKKLLSGKDLNEALAGNEGAIEEANLIANGPKSGNVETGLYLSGSLTNTKQSTKIINSIGSNLIAKNNITLKSGDDINLTMVNIVSKNIFINAGKNINIYAGKSTVESRESTKSLSGSYNLLTDQFSIGAGVTKDELKAENYSNSKIIGENINIKGKDLTIKGANIIGNTVNINVANLHLESLQDKLKSTHKGFNTSGGSSSLGIGKEYSAGLGMEYGNRDKAWVNEQSSIIGRNSANINVAGKTKLVGSVIGGANTILRTGKLEYSDIYDKDKGYDIGLNTNASFSLKRMRDNITQTTYEKLLIDKTGELNYGATDREQINRATIGNGTIIVGGKIVNPDINRDESKAQEITKDINVNKISLQYTDNRRDWSLGSVQDILGEYFKNTVIEPIEGLNQKLKLYEKFDFFKSNTPRYKYVVEKDLNGNIIRYDPVRLADDAIFDKGSVAHINGMNTDLNYALREVERQHLMKSLDDYELSKLERGKKKEFIVFQNETHGNWSDLVESAYDKFGIKGRRKIYSNAAKEVGETIYLNRDRIDDFTMFSQGNIQWRAGLEYMEEKYGEGVLKEITTKRYHSLGSPYNAKDLITFLRNKEMIKNPDYTNVEIKNDTLDIVANVVGFNGMSIVSRDKKLQEKIDNKKYNIWDPHSGYTAGTKPTSKIEYRAWQMPLIGIDKILRLFNPKEYFNKEKYNPTINKGADENDKK